MPNTIPTYDQIRVLMSYLLRKQLAGKPTTLKQASQRMGIGSDKILKLMDDNGVKYTIINTANKRVYKYQEIAVQSIPYQWTVLLSLSEAEIAASYARMVRRKIEVRQIENRRTVAKRERERQRKENMRYFLEKD